SGKIGRDRSRVFRGISSSLSPFIGGTQPPGHNRAAYTAEQNGAKHGCRAAETCEGGHSMSYQYDSANGVRIRVELRGEQTSVMLHSAAPGQQQSQTAGFATGAWSAPPSLFRTPSGLVLRVEGVRGTCYVLLGLGGIQVSSEPISL